MIASEGDRNLGLDLPRQARIQRAQGETLRSHDGLNEGTCSGRHRRNKGSPLLGRQADS